MFGAQTFCGVYLGQMEAVTPMSKSCWLGREAVGGNSAIPADLGHSHPLLPWHLLHGSLKKFGKLLPDVF